VSKSGLDRGFFSIYLNLQVVAIKPEVFYLKTLPGFSKTSGYEGFRLLKY
jgi:hypothetical protein